jgi:hypothetical protein
MKSDSVQLAGEIARDEAVGLGNAKPFQIKDSGKRAEFASGMVRDLNEGKQRPDLVRDGPMLQRWITLMTNGAKKYAARNWMKAEGDAEFQRFLESADRHFNIWFTWRMYGVNIEDINNPTDTPLAEDHAAAVIFNINGAEYLKDKQNGAKR